MGADSEWTAQPTIAEPPNRARPNQFAHILATAIISSVSAAIITKLLGRKAGFAAALVTASAHEVLDAPLAEFIGTRLGLMTT